MDPFDNFTGSDRVVERGRGCWNCIHYDCGDAAKEYYRIRIGAEKRALALRAIERGDIGAASGGPLTIGAFTRQSALERPGRHVVDARFALWDAKIASGEIGLCMNDGTDTDFVHRMCLCVKWSGRQGSSLATEGKKLDLLPDELRDVVDGKAKKV